MTSSPKEHQELASICEQTPPNAAMQAKHGTSGVGHCRGWAQLEVEQAKEAEALAANMMEWRKKLGKK